MQTFKQIYTDFVKGDVSAEVLAAGVDAFLQRYPDQYEKVQVALAKLLQARKLEQEEYSRILAIVAERRDNPPEAILESSDPTTDNVEKTIIRSEPTEASATEGNTTGGQTTGITTSGQSQFTWTGFGQSGPSVTLEIGSLIKDRFLLHSVIGSGGMGLVYKAKDLLKEEAQDRNPWVAIKVLNDDFKKHPEALRALQRESRKSQDLSHPNIITVFDFDRDGGNVYMTMELMEGKPLDKFIRGLPENPIPIEEALRISSEMGQALSYAHRKGIVHSDFKPGNVFLIKNNAVKVFDFGIARASKQGINGAEGEMTRFDAGTLGALTPAYASLEMMQGQEPDARDDIYALACVTYELLTGKHPFGKKSADIAQAEKMVVAPVPGLDHRQMRGLLKGLAFERANRSPSVDAFLDDMRKKNISKAAMGSGIAAAVVLVIAGAVGIPFYIEKNKVESLIAVITQGDGDKIVTALNTIDQLDKDTRKKVISDLEAQEGIIHFIQLKIATIFDLEKKQYDYQGAKALLKRGTDFYKDSPTLKELADNIDKNKNTLMLMLDNLYTQYLESGKLMADGTDDNIPAVLTIVQKVEPDSYLLRDKRLPNAYLSSAKDHLLQQDFNSAEKITAAGLQRFTNDAALVNLQDIITTEKNTAVQAARLAELTSSVDSLLTNLSPETDIKNLETTVLELRGLDGSSTLIKRIQAKIETLASTELDKASAEQNWSAYETIVARYKSLTGIVWLAQKQAVLADTTHGANQGLSQTIEKAAKAELASGLLKLNTLLDKPDFTPEWESSIRILLEDLDALAAAYNQVAELNDVHQRIASVYAERINDAITKERFTEADNLLARANKLSTGSAKLTAQAALLATAKDRFEQARQAELRLAKIEALKQTLLTQAKADDVIRARKSRDELDVLAPADEFLKTEAPKALVSAYTHLFEAAAKAKQYDKAASLAQAALEIMPNDVSIKAELQRYTVELKKSDFVKAFQSPSKNTLADAEKWLTDIRAELSTSNAAALQQELVKPVSASIKTLLSTDIALARMAFTSAKQLFGDDPALRDIVLPVEETPSEAPAAEPVVSEPTEPTAAVKPVEPPPKIIIALSLEELAEKGDIESQVDLASYYLTGSNGRKKNPKEAARWYEMAAKNTTTTPDVITAQAALAGMYFQGEGVPKDIKKAFSWFLKAANGGDVPSQRVVATFYMAGTDIPQNYTESFKWFSKASSKGDTDSQSGLGFLYFQGFGVKQDYAKAFELFSKAGKKGDVSSQSALGVMLLKGIGVTKDYAKAYAWLAVAVANGNTDSQALMDEAAAALSPEALKNAQAEAKALSKSSKSSKFN
jgi:serine/threonine protein kinase